MKYTKRQVVLWTVIVVFGLAFVTAIVDPLTFLRRAEYRGEVRGLCETLQLDMTREQVQRAMNPTRFPHLSFRREQDSLWLASAPYEFGAQSWVLVIEFQGDRVSALRVRMHDGFEEFQRPADAPPDRVRHAAWQ